MCSLLKNQACDLENTLGFCETIKDDVTLKHAQNDAIIQVGALVLFLHYCTFDGVDLLLFSKN